MTVDLLPSMVSSNDVPASGNASVNSSSEESHHPSVVSDLFDGDLGVDELNEIPQLPDAGTDTYDFEMVHTLLDDSHPATHIAMTASAIDGALGNFGFLPVPPQIISDPLSSTIPQQVPILPADARPTAVGKETTKGTKRTSAKKTGAATKKRRVSKSKAGSDRESPVRSPKLISAELPTLVSPSSSASSGLTERKTTITFTSDASMPLLPGVSGSVPPLLPKPTAEAAKPAAPAPVQSEEEPESAESNEALVVSLGPTNITTEHIRMLTSESGPAECAKAIVATSTHPDGRRTSKAHLTQEQRAQASRDRNREHARNTRLRKKAYVEELKRTLIALCEQRDADQLEDKRKTKLDQQHRNVRLSVLEEFLRLRGTNVMDVDRWAAILKPGFSLRLPTINGQEQAETKTLVGVEQVMSECHGFSAFLQTLGCSAGGISTQYTADKDSLFMDGNNVVLEWEASTVGAAANGAKGELKFYGNIKAQFDPESNKIVSATMVFDSGTILSQKRSLAAV